MEKVKVGTTINLWFTTRTFSTGVITDADSLPTCAVYEDATDTAILSPTVVKQAATTGVYHVPVACTGANGFEAGKSYNVLISATVASVSDIAPIASFQCVTNDLDDLSTFDDTTDTVLANVTQISGDSIAADNLELDYDGTGYAKANSTIGTATTVTNTVTANMTQISGDSVAADNLEADYDGTGYAKANSTVGTVTDVTNPVTATVSDKTGFSLSAAGIDAIWDEVVENSGTDNETARQILKLCLAVLGGNSAGGGTVNVNFKRGDGSTAAVTATVDENGNRTVTGKNLA